MNRSLTLAGSILFIAALTPVTAQADNPREFLQNALQGDNSEIMLGHVAADHARSPAVRDFGKTLIDDHVQARNEVLDIGRRFGLGPDREPAPQAREERDRLMGMRGREFDREFIRYMIDDHRKDIAEFRDEAREHHGAVSDLARNQLPTLRKHLETAMALDRDRGRFDEGRFDQTRDRGDQYDNNNRNNSGGNYSDRNNGDYRR
jgi:putative membrane protein